MPYPESDPDWATDTNIATGTESGTPTKVDPGSGYRHQGFVPGATFVGPYVNFQLHRLGRWVTAYLKDLHNQVEFLNKAYTWTGGHTFNTADVTTLTATNGVVFSSYLHTAGRVRITGGSGEFEYNPAQARTNVQISMSGGEAGPGGGFINTSDELVQTNGGATERFCVRLPRGAVLQSVEAIYEKDSVASGATAGYLAAARWSRDWVTPGPSVIGTNYGQANATASTSPQPLSLTGLSDTFGADDVLVITVSGLATLSTNAASFHGLRMSFDDPGPRNY